MALVEALVLAALCQQPSAPDAVNEFSKAYDRNPASAEAAYNFALALLNDQRPVEALAVLEKSRASTADAFALRGAVLNALNRGEDAAAALRRSVAIDPGNPDTTYDLAVTLLKVDSVPEAADLLTRARQRFPRGAAIFAASGMTAYRMGKYDDSIRFYETAVRLEPKAADFHASLGDVHDATGTLVKAEAAYARAVQLDSAFRVKHGRSLLKLQRTREAQSEFELALKQNPNDADARFQLGKLAASSSDFAAAVKHLERAVAIDPALKEAWYQLGLSYHRTGQEDKSRAAMEQSRKLP